MEGQLAERLYSIREASRLLGLKPATLRAWERRFGVPRPRRAVNGYRLYSRADITVLRQLMTRIDEGARIGNAVESLPASTVVPSLELDGLRYRLAHAILRLDEPQATSTLREALALHPVETVLAQVIEPMLVWLGEEWMAGRVSIAVEHFASALFVRQLIALYLAAPEAWRPGRTLAACLPGEQHEIGLLSLVVGLRRRGWHVSYLGANLPFDEMERAAGGLQPEVILLSATAALDHTQLDALAEVVLRMKSSRTEVVLGGLGVRGKQAELTPAEIPHGGFSEVLAALETILVRRTHAHADR
jgi:DNA-binding transcriptional MerR regulator/methylmalonyl-CoA mutase cobalamin-binding subunit